MRLKSLVSLRLTLSFVITAVGLAAISAPAWATFPGTNGRIAFASNGAGDLDIYAMEPDGSGIVNITADPGTPGFDLEPEYSPDGTKIAFRAGRANAAEIYTMNANGTGVTRLTFNSARDAHPYWSPNGSQIVFTSSMNDPNFGTCLDTGTCNTDIFVVRATGGSVRQLTFDGGADGNAEFSPDGRFVGYETDVSGASAIYDVNVRTLAVTKLTADSLQAGQPDWSPDGSKIAFINNFYDCNVGNQECKSNIFVMNATGGSVTQLTNNFGNNLDVTWSPGGDKIVFSHSDNVQFNRQDIYMMNPDGTGITRITQTNDNNFGPTWGSG
jgi:Tol biopolymer transport system component